MITVIQRVKYSNVKIDNEIVAEINQGLLALVGFTDTDTIKDLEFIFNKLVNLRIFSDDNDKLNLSLLDIKGELLIVPQFTLYGDCLKGRRPNFTKSAPIDKGKQLFDKFRNICLTNNKINIKFGVFQADMQITIINDGPVTLIINSEEKFN